MPIRNSTDRRASLLCFSLLPTGYILMVVTTRNSATRQVVSGSKGRDTLADLFGVDGRSLAVLRIGIAALLIVDSVTGYLGAEGPLASLDDPLWEVLRVVVLLPALMLLIGFKSRIATIACWLIYSHAIRTSFSIPGAPVPFESYVLTLVLFWGMFLPLGGSASLDSRTQSTHRRPSSILSVASAGLLIQVFFIYFSSGVTKDLGEWLFGRTALLDVLSNPRHGSDFGQALTEYPGLLSVLSVATIALEILGPVLLFVPGKQLARRRTVLVALFIAFHIGLAATMTLGIFPFLMMVVWCVFIPIEFWERWSQQPDRLPAKQPLADNYSWRTVLASTALAIVVVSNVITWFYYPADSGLPATIQDGARYLALYQQWTMFSVPSTL